MEDGILNVFNNRTLTALAKALDGSSLKHRTIAHNIANINTPGYKRKEVNFQEQLKVTLEKSQKNTLATTHSQHIHTRTNLSNVKPIVFQDNSTSMRPDKNNVDLDQEMTQNAANNIYYNAVIGQLNKRISLLKHVITEGRR